MISFNDFLRAGGMTAILGHAVSVVVDPMTPDPQKDKDGFVKLHLVLHPAYKHPDGSGNGGLESASSPAIATPIPKEDVANLLHTFRGSVSSSNHPLTPRSDRCDELCVETGNKGKEVLRVDEGLDVAQTPKRTPSVLPTALSRSETSSPPSPPPSPATSNISKAAISSLTKDMNATSRCSSEESFSEIQPNEPLMEDIHANHETLNIGLRHDLNLSYDHVEELDSSKLLEKSCGRSMSRRSMKGFLRKTSNVARSMLFGCFKGRQ